MSAFVPKLDPGIGFALLAAGGASRFGGGKLGADIGGKPLIRWAADAVERAGFRTRLLVVASACTSDFGLAHDGWTIVVNPDAETGLASSIRTAAVSARSGNRLVIGLADMPFVSSEHYRALALLEGVVFTSYPAGRKGVPAGFDRKSIARLEALRGDRGATAIDWDGATAIMPPSEHQLLDVDTIKDLSVAQAIAGSC